MRRFLAPGAALLLAAACAKQGYEPYQDPEGGYSFDAPKGWAVEGNAGLGRKPVSTALFVGHVAAQDEGVPLGAVLSVTKLYRARAAHPGGDKAFQEFRRTVLLPTEVLFGEAPASALPENLRQGLAGGVKDTTLAGLPAKTYRREFEHYNRLHMPKPVAMRLEDVVVQTPEAYFVLEYRATRELFDKHYGAFKKAKDSFRLLGAKSG